MQAFVKRGAHKPPQPSPASSHPRPAAAGGSASIPAWQFASTPLTAPGEASPLPAPLRHRLEARIGTGLPDITLHRGPVSAGAATALGARAYTYGRSIVLGAGTDPAAREAFPLLAHEAAHVAQQAQTGFGAGVPLRTRQGDTAEREADAAAIGHARPTPQPAALATAPPPNASFLPASPRFAELWTAYEQASGAAQIAKALDLARQIARIPNLDFKDLIAHGIELTRFLQDNNEPALAADMLDQVRNAYLITDVTIGGKLPPLGWSVAGSGPDTLIAAGEDAARAGRTAQAIQDLGTAYEILSFYARDLTDSRTEALRSEAEADEQIGKASGTAKQRLQALRGAAELPRALERTAQYSTLGDVYAGMRRILGVYDVLEREALAGNDTAKAAVARTDAQALRTALRDSFSISPPTLPGSIGGGVIDPVETAEVNYVDTPRGPGLRLYGANAAETDLTQLPGLPSPKEVGNNTQVQTLGNLQQALGRQADLQAELARELAIRTAFANKPIDLTDTGQRQKAWRIMYGVFAKAGGNPLGALMALIGRYEQAYAIHTTYNVRDWGVNYLDTKMPTDLAGRIEKDCGVFALTVAWDVFETAKHASPALDLNFELYSMLEHVTLVITDTATNSFYLVNNDQITGPHTGDKLSRIGSVYQGVRGLAYTVGPSVPVSLGSTKTSERGFHDQAWERYKASADWGLAPTPLAPDVQALARTDPDAYDRAVLDAREGRYKTFYAAQEELDRGLRALDPLIDALTPLAADATRFPAALAPVVDQAALLARQFAQLGPRQPINAGSAATHRVLPSTSSYVFSLEAGKTVHPLARAARAVLHLQALGGTPSPTETALVQFCDSIPMFHDVLSAYRSGGAAGPF